MLALVQNDPQHPAATRLDDSARLLDDRGAGLLGFDDENNARDLARKRDSRHIGQHRRRIDNHQPGKPRCLGEDAIQLISIEQQSGIAATQAERRCGQGRHIEVGLDDGGMVSSYWGRRNAALPDTNASFAAAIQSFLRS